MITDGAPAVRPPLAGRALAGTVGIAVGSLALVTGLYLPEATVGSEQGRWTVYPDPADVALLGGAAVLAAALALAALLLRRPLLAALALLPGTVVGVVLGSYQHRVAGGGWNRSQCGPQPVFCQHGAGVSGGVWVMLTGALLIALGALLVRYVTPLPPARLRRQRRQAAAVSGPERSLSTGGKTPPPAADQGERTRTADRPGD